MRRRFGDRDRTIFLIVTLIDDGDAAVVVHRSEQTTDSLVVENLVSPTGDLVNFASYIAGIRQGLFDVGVEVDIGIYVTEGTVRARVKRMEEERTSAGGIVIPDSATEKPSKGEVLAIGNGKILENGEVRGLDVKAGDKVLFGKYSGTEVKVDDEELLVMREDDIMAVIEG